MAKPPSAGPIARLMLKLVLLIAMALSRSSLATSIGVIMSHAGAASAPVAPRANEVARRAAGVARCAETRKREGDGDREDRRLRADQETARIDDVGERAGRQRQKEHRQRGGDLNRRHHHRVGIEVGHQPARRRVVHGDADVRQRTRNQNDGERQVAEQPGLCADGGVRSDAGLAGQGALRPRGHAPSVHPAKWQSNPKVSRRSGGREMAPGWPEQRGVAIFRKAERRPRVVRGRQIFGSAGRCAS